TAGPVSACEEYRSLRARLTPCQSARRPPRAAAVRSAAPAPASHRRPRWFGYSSCGLRLLRHAIGKCHVDARAFLVAAGHVERVFVLPVQMFEARSRVAEADACVSLERPRVRQPGTVVADAHVQAVAAAPPAHFDDPGGGQS